MKLPSRTLLAILAASSLGACVHSAPRQRGNRSVSPPPQVVVRYFGPHLVPEAEGGGWCLVEGVHDHAFAPVDARDYRYTGGVYYWSAPVAATYWGAHPDPYGGWCHVQTAHRHDYHPPRGHQASFHYDRQRGHYAYTDRAGSGNGGPGGVSPPRPGSGVAGPSTPVQGVAGPSTPTPGAAGPSAPVPGAPRPGHHGNQGGAVRPGNPGNHHPGNPGGNSGNHRGAVGPGGHGNSHGNRGGNAVGPGNSRGPSGAGNSAGAARPPPPKPTPAKKKEKDKAKDREDKAPQLESARPGAGPRPPAGGKPKPGR